ncbi:MAG: methyl-accepting chemotaxis protein [Sedimentibacter sp.]|uniref:methyl-accepting chemotaxis protein n=1 Tax=Sedimentibacter sp. TaxID=1960295 RepID=UPI003158218B
MKLKMKKVNLKQLEIKKLEIKKPKIKKIKFKDFKFTKEMTIRKRLLYGFAAITVLLTLIGLFSIFALNKINNSISVLKDNCIPSINYAHSINTAQSDYRINQVNHAISQDPAEKDSLEENMNQLDKNVREYISSYKELATDEENLKLINEIETRWNSYTVASEKMISMSRTGRSEEAVNMSNDELKLFSDNLSKALGKLVEYNQNIAQQESKASDNTYSSAVVIMLVAMAAAIAASILLSLAITRSIVGPVNQMVEIADELAAGNVNVEVSTDKKDELGRLMAAFARMIENIRTQAMVAKKMAEGRLDVEIEARSEGDMLGKAMAEMIDKNNEVLSSISVAAEQVASGAIQISEGSIALSQGATEQASSIEELTASLEEISSQTELNAQNADKANKIAAEAKNGAIRGNDLMNEMLKAMDEISSSSAEISKIIKVIDDIASQTNILALNAAVEAARAGQHGKGFAVVADEVRNLAARSANAAKETTDMIESSIRKSEDGTKIAKNTAAALNKIVDEVEKAANLISDIAIASNEQAAGLEQINVGVMQVSQVVQANSATSEESAAASQELTEQAQMLKEMVGRFKLKVTTTKA